MSSKRPKPEDDIGPLYKFLAVLFSLAAVGLLIIHANAGKDSTWVDVGMMGVVGSMVLALIRPKWFDNFIKSIADKIPFLSFTKKDDK